MEPQHTSTVLSEIISMNDSISNGLDAVAQCLGTQINRPHSIRFSSMGPFKDFRYATPVNDAEDLWERVQNACQVIRDDNLVFE
jgi:RNAse (barnase) inhibitor barstar